MMHERIISNLSSPWTGNNVKLLVRGNERFVRKVFGGKTGYLRETHAYRVLSEKLRPKLLRDIPTSLTIEISYDPVAPNTVISDFDIGTLMSQLHASTMGISPCVRDPGTELVAPTWLEYIRTQSGKWVDIIERHMGRKVTDQLTTLLSLVESQGNPKICLIHRDIRRANIGSRDNSLVLLDYELAIWGDPLWDVGRYLLDCPSRDDFLAGYGMPDSEVLIAYTGLFAFSFAEYLIRHGYNSGEDFKNCVRAIFNGRL